MADSSTGTENTQYKYRVFFQYQKIKKCSKTDDEVMSKGHRRQLKELPNGKSCNNLNKISNVVLDSNSKYKINIHEAMVIYMNE